MHMSYATIRCITLIPERKPRTGEPSCIACGCFIVSGFIVCHSLDFYTLLARHKDLAWLMFKSLIILTTHGTDVRGLLHIYDAGGSKPKLSMESRVISIGQSYSRLHHCDCLSFENSINLPNESWNATA